MSLTIVTAEVYYRNTTAITAEIDGQLVALDVNAGVCFGLNEVATYIWGLLDGATSVDDICAALMDRYAVDRATCEAETTELLRELVDIGLIGRR